MKPNLIHAFNFDPAEYYFRREICALLGVEDLENLHTMTDVGDLVSPGKDGLSHFHNLFYDRVKNSLFEQLYHGFAREVIRKHCYDEPIIYQSQPTFRIQYVGNLGVGAFHRDSDYNHPVEELNYWLPVTQAYGTNTIWIESERGRHDYHPQKVDYGQVLTFPGGVLMHGNRVNDTPITRVSFDFRVIPKSAWKPDNDQKSTLTFGKKLSVGDYYREIE